jgi:hypothetical protein
MLRHSADLWRRHGIFPQGKSPKWDYSLKPEDKNLDCFVQPASAKEIEVARVMKNYELDHVVWFAEDYGIKFMDRLIFNGRTLQVQAPPVNLMEMDEAWRADCKEVQWMQDNPSNT